MAQTDDTPPPIPEPSILLPPTRASTAHQLTLQREIKDLKGRLVREATTAIGMIESSIEALFKLDDAAARGVMRRDDEIDAEEVHIEEECFRLLALFNPMAKDFRAVTTLLRVNADLERVADHATSISKQTIKLKALGVARWPTSLTELGQRVPILCHALLAALVSENADAAGQILLKDKAIDNLDKRLFDECLDIMGEDRSSKAAGMLLYRCGRELERIGDLMTNIAEDVIYMTSGFIVRHEGKKKARERSKA